MILNNPHIGDKVTFAPSTFTQFERISAPVSLHGRICYINEAHRYYTVEAECNGYMIRESFKY